MEQKSARQALLESELGTATIEYVIVLVAVALPLTLAVIFLGPGLVDFFEIRVMWLSLPLP